mmetsp:Transcript_21339/g.34344  ORF Transcript_21339/g.34344 Transcript_21339/m.34344 type:complete len:420 (+) Transcript_21339:944-2203(+)
MSTSMSPHASFQPQQQQQQQQLLHKQLQKQQQPQQQQQQQQQELATQIRSVELLRFLADGSCGQVAIAAWADRHNSRQQKNRGARLSLYKQPREDLARVIAQQQTWEGSVDIDRSNELLAEFGSFVDLPLNFDLPAADEEPEAPFALKIVSVQSLQGEGADTSSRSSQVLAEVDMIRKIANMPQKSPLILDFHFSLHAHGNIYIGMELCAGGDLFTHLYKEELQPEEIVFYTAEIAAAIQHLHDHNIMHGDLKPENIGISGEGHVRLLDFGLAMELNEQEHLDPVTGRLQVVTTSGTLSYSAPEILKREKHGFETDWWSLGVILYEMCFGCWPWGADTAQETCNLICVAPLDFPLEDRPIMNEFKSLLRSMLRKDPTRRICYELGLRDLKTHSLFRIIDWDILVNEGYQAPLAATLQMM